MWLEKNVLPKLVFLGELVMWNSSHLGEPQFTHETDFQTSFTLRGREASSVSSQGNLAREEKEESEDRKISE